AARSGGGREPAAEAVRLPGEGDGQPPRGRRAGRGACGAAAGRDLGGRRLGGRRRTGVPGRVRRRRPTATATATAAAPAPAPVALPFHTTAGSKASEPLVSPVSTDASRIGGWFSVEAALGPQPVPGSKPICPRTTRRVDPWRSARASSPLKSMTLERVYWSAA